MLITVLRDIVLDSHLEKKNIGPLVHRRSHLKTCENSYRYCDGGAHEILAVPSFIIGLLCHNSRIRLAHLINLPCGDDSLTSIFFMV